MLEDTPLANQKLPAFGTVAKCEYTSGLCLGLDLGNHVGDELYIALHIELPLAPCPYTTAHRYVKQTAHHVTATLAKVWQPGSRS